VVALIAPSAASASPQSVGASAHLLVAGLAGGAGSTVGPGGALYVTERDSGRITRVDPRTGATSTFASGLPTALVGWGGPVDIAFMGHTAYVLVTLVGPDVGGSDAVGIYRVDGPSTFTVVADIGAWAAANPPKPDFFVPTGVQYAMEPFRGDFLVSDGHHNRVLRVSLDGKITEVIAFGDIVPTGLARTGNTIYLAEAGPVPHRPQDGKIVKFGPGSTDATEVASGRSLLVDVELGRGHTLYALSQGDFSGGPEGSPALPNTGRLVRVNGDGTFTDVMTGLNQPTALEFIRGTAYVVTFGGEIWAIEGV
jgi:sugar lactone lactonase YvrE